MSGPLRVAVIGGGITGLAAAHRLYELAREKRLAVEIILFEAAARLGGVIHTRHIGPYLVETGSDMFITDKPWALDLCRRLGLDERLLSTDQTYRGSQVVHRGRPVPVPEGFLLMAPAKFWPIVRSPLFSLRGKLRMGWECCVPRRSDPGDESLAGFVRRRFGAEVLDRLVQPLVGGIYTSDPERLSLEATLPRFAELERRYGSLIRGMRRQRNDQGRSAPADSGARYGLFVTLAGGLSELIDALQSRIAESAEIRLNTAVERIERTADGGWCLVSRDTRHDRPPTRNHCDSVIVSTPAFRAADLLEQTDAELAALLRRIEYASTAVVVSGHRLADIRDPLDAFGVVVPAIERRQILAVSYASRKFPGRAPEGRVLLRTFVGGALQPELLGRPDAEILDIVRHELHVLLGVAGEPDFAEVARHVNAMPQYHVGHLDLVAEIQLLTEKWAGLALAGNAYHGVGIPDCVRSGEAAAERILAER